MLKVKTLPILAALVFLSFLGVRPASAATCTLTFDPPTVKVGTASKLSWNISGSFASAKMGCAGTKTIEPTDVTDYVRAPGSIDWLVESIGSEQCSLYLDGATTATCNSNYLGGETDAICTYLKFRPSEVNEGENSVLSWSVVDGSFYKASLECTGPNEYNTVMDVTDALKLTPQGSIDWTTTNGTGKDFCKLLLDSKHILLSAALNPSSYCQSNELTIVSGSGACGSQGEKVLSYGATLNASSPNLCASGASVGNFQKWCGLYLWTCGSSTSWCKSYTQGKCGSSANSTVAKGGLTATSTTLCDGATDDDKKASYFQDTGSAYTWKCGKEDCGDGRVEDDGVVDCSATISGGSSTPKIECSFNPETITVGGTTILSYDGTINGGITKVTVTGTGIFESTEADLPALSSRASTVVNKVGSGSAIFKGYNSANTLVATCTAPLTVNQGGGTIPTATVSPSAAPASVKPGQISYLTWTSQNASTMEVECTGPFTVPRGGIQITSALWQAAAAAAGTYNPPAGTPDGFPATFTEVSSTPEVCTFYPYGSDGTLGTSKSVTITITNNTATCGNGTVEEGEDCEVSSPFSPFTPTYCPTGKKCDSECQCVACTANCSCASSTCVGSTCPDGCDRTCPGTKTDGVCVNCSTWSLALGATPTSGQAPLTVNLIATTQQVAGGETYLYSEHSCGTGGPAATNVNGKNFTCVYPTAGTYQPSIKVTAQSTGCVKNASATATVNAASYSCTGSVPTGSTMCTNDNTGLTATLPWQSVGTSASNCTTARKCEYYTSSGGTCGGIDVWTAKGPTLSWNGVAMSSDGRIQTAVSENSQIYVSIDSGNTWSPKDSNRLWYGVAMSSDGKIQTAVPLSGQLYVSTDSGDTWTAKDSNRGWRGIDMSSDGKFQTATVYGGKIYVSNDFGNTWAPKESDRHWFGVALSSDGKFQTTGAYDNEKIYVSSDFGNTWSPKEANRNWVDVAMSSDGRIQTAADRAGQIYVSTDSGNSWTAKDSNRYWNGVDMSSDGKIQTAIVSSGSIYISTDSGNTWVPKGANRDWYGIAMSSDGKTQIASAKNGQIYLSCDGSQSFSCTGSELIEEGTKCANDDTDLTATLPWKTVGFYATGCTDERKCEYWAPSSVACGSQFGKVLDYGATLNANSPNLCRDGVGSAQSFQKSCGAYIWTCPNILSDWCRSYTQGKCGSVSGTTVVNGSLTKDSSNLCAGDKPSYFTNTGIAYTWKCGKDGCEDGGLGTDGMVSCSAEISNACDLTANLTALPTTGSAPLKTDLTVSAQSTFEPIQCSNQDCNGGTISSIDTVNGCKFTCTYNTNGTYTPKVHVTNPNCSKDPTASVIVTGGSPTCAAETCIGNSCWDGTKYIPGTKTQDCAYGSATADPATLTTPNTSYIKWNSSGASKMDFACAGPINAARGGWYLNDAACKSSGAVEECTDKGYGMAFGASQVGTEICVFYPYNSSDGQLGTPFTVMITSNKGIIDGKCGTAARTYAYTETSWGNYTLCSAGTADPTSPTFPATGGSTTWKCIGVNGGTDSGECQAKKANTPLPGEDDWSVSISADPTLGNPPLKVELDASWSKSVDFQMTVEVIDQSCGADNVLPKNNKSLEKLDNYFECEYPTVGTYKPSITYEDNAGNKKTATTTVSVTDDVFEDDCQWSAYWKMNPAKETYAIGETIQASLYLYSGLSASQFSLSNRSCGSSAVSPRIIDDRSFSCTYPESGVFRISATVKRENGCAKDIQAYSVYVGSNARTCKPDDSNCAARTCKERYCWNGCELIKGTSNDCD